MEFLAIFLLFFSITYAQAKHPNLIITKNDVEAIKQNLQKYPLLIESYSNVKNIVDNALLQKIDVPIPKDAAGYTHEKHKQNYTEMMLAGIVYQVSQENKYALFIKNMLLKYAELYPTLGKHPAAVSKSPGRLFWQSLNETVWMVNSIQAYDCIYDFLLRDERKIIEENVFRKMAEYFIIERNHEFNLIHNHGTWMTAAVGMTGFVLGDKDFVEKSLSGTNKDNNGGYLKQLETLLSPDGYYTEGAYYIRYAIQPFFLFAEAIENNLPELKIYEYRNQILKKCFYTTLQLTYSNGDFIPINDAIKEKNFLSPEIVVALNLTYKRYGYDKTLLDIASKQNNVMINGAGLTVAKDLSENDNLPNFDYKSMELTDGKDGNEGGLALLRFGKLNDQSLLVMKYTSHGLSHGHFDKLSFLYYDNGKEIIQDYGAARFVNIEPKYGGRYLPENKSFAMQSIAHNTIVVDEKSHFNAKQEISEKFHSERHFFSCNDKNIQIVSAKDKNAYDGIVMQRTMALVKDPDIAHPFIIDVFKINSDETHQYDLPFYYSGHLMSTNLKYTANDKVKKVLGTKNGYQHLWNEAEGNCNGLFRFTWFTGNRFYTLTNNADDSTKIFFTRIGGTDPNFNLRNEPSILIRREDKSNVFASVIEAHGNYDGIKEYSAGFEGVIEEINVLGTNDSATIIEIKGKGGLNWLLMINNRDSNESEKHSVDFNGKNYSWTGNYKLIKNQNIN